MKIRILALTCTILFVNVNYTEANPLNESKSRLIKVESRPWVKNNPDVKWRTFDTQILDSLENFVPKKHKENIYGSLTTIKHKATGFFRTEKINNRWWIIDPMGYKNLQRVVNGVRQNSSKRNKEALIKTFNTPENWIKKTMQDLRGFSFNGIGSWSDTELIVSENNNSENKFSYTEIINFMSSYGKKRGGTYQLPGNTGYPNQCIFVFDE